MQFLIGGWHAKSLVKEEGKLLLNTYLLNEAHTFMLTGVRYWHKLFKTPVPNYSSKRKRNWNCGEYKSIKSYHQWILCARKMVRNIIVKAIFFHCLFSMFIFAWFKFLYWTVTLWYKYWTYISCSSVNL